MEHIGKTLHNLSTEKITPNYNPNVDTFQERTLEERREDLRVDLCVSTLGNTFETFKPWQGTEESKTAFEALSSGETDWQMLLCYGGVGNGKTHLCEATVIALYRRGLFSRVLTMDRIMGSLKRCMNPDHFMSLEEQLHNFSHMSRLILDDVADSIWEFEQLEKIIRVRYRENLLTVLTTNLDIKELPERIVSRFRDPEKGRVILNEGEDYRPHKGGLNESIR